MPLKPVPPIFVILRSQAEHAKRVAGDMGLKYTLKDSAFLDDAIEFHFPAMGSTQLLELADTIGRDAFAQKALVGRDSQGQALDHLKSPACGD